MKNLYRKYCYGSERSGERNRFPASYQGIGPEAMPAELYPVHTALEYRLPSHAPPGAAPPRPPPAFLFVLDTALPPAEVVVGDCSLRPFKSAAPCIIWIYSFGHTVICVSFLVVHEILHSIGVAFCAFTSLCSVHVVS